MSTFKILFLGDLVGQPGQQLFAKWAQKLVTQYNADMLVVNGENSANNGRGITPSIYNELKKHGAHVVTTGNHVWGNRGVHDLIASNRDLLRPLNFPSSCPGKGYVVTTVNGIEVAVVNIQGRVFMNENLSCPFRELESALTYLKTRTKIILVDFHAETTSETQGMGFHFDGKVSALVGTHTHVQTADERVLPKGTAYITDAGCSAALNSMLGMKKEPIIYRFINQMPVKFSVETEGPFALHGVVISIDSLTGLAQDIERIRIIDEDLTLS